MGIHARAKKRAEADALKQRYDVELVGIQYEEGGTLPSGEVIEGVVIEEHEVVRSGRSEDQIMRELGFDPEPERFDTEKKLSYRHLLKEGHEIGLVDDPDAEPPSDPQQLEAALYDLEQAIKEYKQAQDKQGKLL
ncbi:MAG: hypothetical protein ACWGQW_19620, partial [bacterium]